MVSAKLGTPILDPRLWNMRIDALPVLMPKATAYVDDFAESRKNQIRFAGKIKNM